MRYVCPHCNQGLYRISEKCAGCGRVFDPAEWPEEAYSIAGMRSKLRISWDGKTFEPSSEDFQIGRSPDAMGLVLPPGAGVSKIHARVFFDNGEWFIDKQSSQDLFVNNQPVERCALTSGAVIAIGAFLLSVSISYEQYGANNSVQGRLCSGEVIPLDRKNLYIGSDPTKCTVLISGTDACHALIYNKEIDEAWWLVDCASSGGVKVNDERIRNKRLYPGDKISVAGLFFIFHGDKLAVGKPESTGIGLMFCNAAAQAKNGFQILQNLSFNIAPGEFVGILGPSGCGKSSLIQRIVGLAKFTDGTMCINGECFEKLPDAYLDSIAYQPQQNTLHPDLTLYEEFAANRTLHALKDYRVKKKDASDAFRLLGLENEVEKRTSQLSGGQQRRAGIALALLRKPQMLVLDEPTSGLDPATETEVMDYLKRISNQDKTVICSTHIMGNIDKFDKIVVLSRGYLVFCGTPGELLSFFRIKNPQELYGILASGKYEEQCQTAEDRSTQFYCSPLAQKYTQRISNISLPKGKKSDFFKQIYGYLKRMFFEMVSFKNSGNWWETFWTSGCFIQLLLQPFLVALVLKMACAYDLVSADGAKEVLFFASVAVFWLGINNSVRELVKERIPWRCLERLERITTTAYLTGKVLWASLLCLLQSLFFSLFFFNLLPKFELANPNTDTGKQLLITGGIFLVLYLVSLTGALMGLSISAIFKKENAAVGLLPIILIPVLFFSQPIIRNGNYSTGYFTPKDEKQEKDSKNYAKIAVAIQKIMPCHAPEVLMDRLNEKRLENSKVAPQKISEAWYELALILGLYMVISLALMITFQIKNETEWDGR